MEMKTKLMVVAGGVLIVVLASTLKRTPDTGQDAMRTGVVPINDAMAQLIGTQARTSADIIINRDNVTGATAIQELRTVQALTQSNNDLAARISQYQSGTDQARIASQTAMAIERSRASVAMTQAKYAYKASKRSANNNLISNIVGGGMKAATSIFGMI